MDKEVIIAELRRVAAKLNTSFLTMQQFGEHAQFSVSTVKYSFGSWNEAVEAAGLEPKPAGGPPVQLKFPEEDLLQEIIRLTQERGREPTIHAMNAKGRFGDSVYRKRFGSLAKACQLAYARYGFSQAAKRPAAENSETLEPAAQSSPTRVVVPKTYKPRDARSRKKVQFGEPIDFRGLRFAPINEQGVVYVSGMISRELGFLIE